LTTKQPQDTNNPLPKSPVHNIIMYCPLIRHPTNKEKAMIPRALLPLLILIATIFSAGCSTAYKAALDERSLSQQTSDASISAAIMKAYLDDDDVSVMGIEPYTFVGHVYLVGEYEIYTQRSKAISIARSVEGVTDITTYLLP
ncbi:hypothetical protein ADUPG1_005446, partial [Aduncisulcus paluster]